MQNILHTCYIFQPLVNQSASVQVVWLGAITQSGGRHQPAAPSRSSSKHYQQAATASSKQHMLQCCCVWWQYGSTCKVCSCPADLSYTAVLVLVGRYWPSGQASTNSPVGASAIHQHLESCRHGSKPPFGCTQPSSCKTGCPALSRVLYHNPTATSQ